MRGFAFFLDLMRLMVKKISQTSDPESVGGYIAYCPKDVQGKLIEIRVAIKQVAPDAFEATSCFDMPEYFCVGPYDCNGMCAWFSFKKSFIGLSRRPPAIQDHEKELSGYAKTKAVVRSR